MKSLYHLTKLSSTIYIIKIPTRVRAGSEQLQLCNSLRLLVSHQTRNYPLFMSNRQVYNWVAISNEGIVTNAFAVSATGTISFYVSIRFVVFFTLFARSYNTEISAINRVHVQIVASNLTVIINARNKTKKLETGW